MTSSNPPVTGDDPRAEAQAALRRDDLQAAREALERAVADDPRDLASWINLGAVCGEGGDTEAAFRALRSALSLDPDSVAAESNLALVERDAGQLVAARNRLRSVMGRDPSNPWLRYHLGHTLFLSGQFAEAAEAYREGLSLDPLKTGTQVARLAWALAGAGDHSRARLELRGALDRVGPDEAQSVLDEAAEVVEGLVALVPESRKELDLLLGIVREWAHNPGRSPAST